MIEIISHTHASELISLSGDYLEQNESENNRSLGYAYRLAERSVTSRSGMHWHLISNPIELGVKRENDKTETIRGRLRVAIQEP